MFGISRQAFYKSQKSKEKTSLQDQRVLELVSYYRAQMPRLGTRKLYWLLESKFSSEGLKVGRDKLFEILRKKKMLIKKKRKYIQTTNSKHWLKKYPNLTVGIKLNKPEQIWVSDITYIRMEKGFCYLSLITDAYSRRIMGYDISNSLSTAGSLRALEMALRSKKYSNSLLHHSDRGLQYCSNEYTSLLRKNKIGISMTERSDPYENALAERINRTIKEEFLLTENFKDISLVEKTVREAVKIYNSKRPHISCAMLTPDQVHFAI